MRFIKDPGKLGNVFIAVGLLLLLAVPASYIYTNLQEWQLQSQLRNRPVPAAPTSVPLAAGAQSSPAPAPATSTPTAIAVPTEVPTATETSEATDLVQALATAAPLATDAATSTPAPTGTPEPTATATPVPVGPPVRVVFPDLRIDAQVTEMGWQDVTTESGDTVSEWQVPEDTAGWAITSAPLGVPGNIVLSAHNNIYGMVFRPISLAWPENAKKQVDAATFSSDILNGRTVELYATDGRRFDYIVSGFYRLHDSGVSLEQRQTNANYMQQTPDPELTLITCWPPWSNTYRLIVRARLVQ